MTFKKIYSINKWILVHEKVLEAQNFLETLKIHKKTNFDQNQLKLSTQHKNMYMH